MNSRVDAPDGNRHQPGLKAQEGSFKVHGMGNLAKWALMAGLFLAGGAGCQHHEASFDKPEESRMFDAVGMRVHPIFTQVKDWSGDGKPDGIEAVIEFTDSFGDPTKASGQVLFELYEYRPKFADIRGHRVVNPWVGSLVNPDEQRSHWSRPARSYSFQLEYLQIDPRKTYVLTATFEKEGGGRLFGQTVLQPEKGTTRPVERMRKGLLQK